MGLFTHIPHLVCVQLTYGSSILGYMECYIKYSRLQGWGSSRSEAQGPTWHSGQDPSIPFVFFMFFLHVFTHCYVGLECPKVFEESSEHETPSRPSFRSSQAV